MIRRYNLLVIYCRVRHPSFLHYLVIALGFTAAIAALSVDHLKLTVLTGALSKQILVAII